MSNHSPSSDSIYKFILIREYTHYMNKQRIKTKLYEWLRRYIPAEILGTILALIAAWVTYNHTHQYIVAALFGWVGEGLGFYGYFIIFELLLNHKKYHHHRFLKRISFAIANASANLLVEFAPAEILDNFLIRPFAMYIAPQYIHPYPVGFLAGKFGADIIFYLFAILGYEIRSKLIH